MGAKDGAQGSDIQQARIDLREHFLPKAQDQQQLVEGCHAEREAATQRMLYEVNKGISDPFASGSTPEQNIRHGDKLYDEALQLNDDSKRNKQFGQVEYAYRSAIFGLKDSDNPGLTMKVGELSRKIGDMRLLKHDFAGAEIFYEATIAIGNDVMVQNLGDKNDKSRMYKNMDSACSAYKVAEKDLQIEHDSEKFGLFKDVVKKWQIDNAEITATVLPREQFPSIDR